MFTNSKIGRFQRKIVYDTLKDLKIIKNAKSVFEVNCGTGFDAEYFNRHGLKVISTDASKDMVAYAKAIRSDAIEFKEVRFNEVENYYENSDFVFSNFGGLNCIDNEELTDFINTLGHLQIKGQKLVFVIMPSFCLIESMYYLLRLNFKQMFRRLKREGVFANVENRKVKTFYYSPSHIKKLLAKDYQIQKVRPVGLFIPPSFIEPLMQKSNLLFNVLKWMDNLFNRISILAMASDHYIIIAEKN